MLVERCKLNDGCVDGGVCNRKVLRKIGRFDGWIGLNGDEAGRWFVVGKLSYMRGGWLNSWLIFRRSHEQRYG
jgi:hypothetical protein